MTETEGFRSAPESRVAEVCKGCGLTVEAGLIRDSENGDAYHFLCAAAGQTVKPERPQVFARHCLYVHGDMLCDGPQGHDGGCQFVESWELVRRLEDEMADERKKHRYWYLAVLREVDPLNDWSGEE
jgi:hypothetical protein